MMKQNKGRIINIGSTACLRMTLFRQRRIHRIQVRRHGLAQHLAWELADSHITVNTVCPGCDSDSA